MSSRETAAIIAYQRSTGVTSRVTSIDDGDHAENSKHYQKGTAGRGLAVDFAGGAQYVRHPAIAAPQLLAIAKSFGPVEHRLYELIHSGLGYSIKAGRRVPMLDVAAHHNHVHVAVSRGVMLAALPAQPHPSAPEVLPMYDPPLGPIAGVWQDDQQRVMAAVTPGGDVYAWGCKWWGNVSGKPYWANRRAARIGARDDGQDGYMVTAVGGETYRLPDGLDDL